jgi:hypothetical protein
MRKIDTMTSDEKQKYWSEKKRSYRANRIVTDEELRRQKKSAVKCLVKRREFLGEKKYSPIGKLADWKRKILER